MLLLLSPDLSGGCEDEEEDVEDVEEEEADRIENDDEEEEGFLRFFPPGPLCDDDIAAAPFQTTGLLAVARNPSRTR
jgi:hypothetical protein